MTVGAGRLAPLVPGVSKIGRMATAATLRGAGAGRAVLEALLAAARARGDHEVALHAQTAAAGFYARQGFAARGAVFEEAGLPHVEMRRAP